MKECTKAVPRRSTQPAFHSRYFVGHGLDVGGKPDPLALHASTFAAIESVRTWDKEDGDGQKLAGVPDASYDFVHSSHCLEHLEDPREALVNWLRVVKPGGHVIVTVPEEDLYEQGQFPSTFNRDHKWTFTIFKRRSWCSRSINLVDLATGLGDEAEILRIEKLDATYRYDLPRVDQTLSPAIESAIELVIRKRPAAEIAAGGRLPQDDAEGDRLARIHWNQYRRDRDVLRTQNADAPPFTDDRPLRR
jgi:SAM-dependent methyltransferase